MLGVPSNYTQTSGQSFYLRNRYIGAFAQDGWRVKSNLNVNLGLRWDLIAPWREKYNQIQTIVPGEQSVLYPNVPLRLVVPGDPGIPPTLSPAKYANFAPRVGVAYSPHFENALLRMLLAAPGKASLRANYGLFYTAFPGLSAGIMYGVPPFGYNYLSPQPPLFSTPFINSSNGVQNNDPFPLGFPPHNVSAQSPYTGFNFGAVTPISADPYFYYRNGVPHTENYMFSIHRQIGETAIMTVSYAGNEGHHLLALVPENVGNSALCLSLSQAKEVASGSSTCGHSARTRHISRQTVPLIEARAWVWGRTSDPCPRKRQWAIPTTTRSKQFCASRWARAQRSWWATRIQSRSTMRPTLGEQTNPSNARLARVLSSWDMTHNFVATYTHALPFDRVFHRNRLSEGWSLSGSTRFSTGFPVTLFDDSDRSLLGTLGNGVNNQLLDTPEYLGGPLENRYESP